MKYTAVWEDRWQTGSHWNCLTRVARVLKRPDETVADCLKRYNILDETVYLFVGWPPFKGQEEAEIQETHPSQHKSLA